MNHLTIISNACLTAKKNLSRPKALNKRQKHCFRVSLSIFYKERIQPKKKNGKAKNEEAEPSGEKKLREDAVMLARDIKSDTFVQDSMEKNLLLKTNITNSQPLTRISLVSNLILRPKGRPSNTLTYDSAMPLCNGMRGYCTI